MVMSKTFSVVIEHDNDGYFASCPQLLGCHSEGETYEEVVANIREAIALCLEDDDSQDFSVIESISVATVNVEVPTR
ncbi:MAG: putative RNase H-like HicB family nuclease [Candidatus Azotimanducaceae bacterium]|jgi:predicted RNase H-like HicB family nuclease